MTIPNKFKEGDWVIARDRDNNQHILKVIGYMLIQDCWFVATEDQSLWYEHDLTLIT